MTAPTAIVVDDEPALIDYLCALLHTEWPELQVVDTAVNGRQALAAIAEHQPDVVFLDIHMPGLSGLHVARQLGDHVNVVFVTAFDRFAVDAFRTEAVDYILKPVTAERLRETVRRLRARHAPPGEERLARVIEQIAGQAPRQYLQWLRAGRGDAVQLVPTQSVVYFRASHKYTSAFTIADEFVLRRSIKDLAQTLDPEQFWRVHRGLIVRVDQIARAERDARGRYRLSLRDRSEQLRTSPAYGHLFKQM